MGLSVLRLFPIHFPNSLPREHAELIPGHCDSQKALPPSHKMYWGSVRKLISPVEKKNAFKTLEP